LRVVIFQFVDLGINFFFFEEFEFHFGSDEGIGFFFALETLFEGVRSVQLIFDVLYGQFPLSIFLEGLDIQSDDVMLKFKIVLFAFVEAAENVDFTVGVIAAGSDSCWDLVRCVNLYFFEGDCFCTFFVEVEIVDDGGPVGFVHQFQEKCLKEIVFAWPEEEKIVLGLVIVPIGEYKQSP
jgi:hypothetical protein